MQKKSAQLRSIFQLTTSRGGRPGQSTPTAGNMCISTHDLTRRSTRTAMSDNRTQKYFNSRPHEEVDIRDKIALFITAIFQLTTSRGGRQHLSPLLPLNNSFQLTTSRGGRPP